MKTTRGLKNNNPGNIRSGKAVYKGEVVPSQDRAFRQFAAPEWGYRAMFVLIDTYRRKYGLETVRQIIGRYAPPCENNTNTYVDAVAKWAGVDPDQKIDTRSEIVMVPIVEAMSRVENGRAAVETDVREGWRLFVGGDKGQGDD